MTLEHTLQPPPYETNALGDAQWLVSMLELFCLEHGHPQHEVNAWIMAQLLNNSQKDTE